MHIIILVVIVLLVWFFISSRQKDRNSRRQTLGSDSLQTTPIGEKYSDKIAFIAKGKLFYRSINGEIQQIHSQYVEDMMDRLERKKQLHGWKEGTSFGTSFTGQTQQTISDQIKIQVTSAQFIGPEKLIYFLLDDSFGGLFEYDICTKQERRLLHKQNLNYQDLALDSKNENILCSQMSASGVANITMLKVDGSDHREVTGGDTVDSAPCRIPDNPNEIVFQSAGLARDPGGFVVAYGPASIQLLDLQNGELRAVADDANFDHLHPRVSRTGDLYFIRRPYDVPKYSSSNLLTDFLFFPFRLLRAVFHYLNFFSLMYSRKPLTSASGPQVKADLKDIIVKGKRIDAENALRKETPVNGVPSLVPKTWQLICRNTAGQEQVLATNVASFNLTSNDQVIYSNGYGVFLLQPANGVTLIFRDKLIADVIVN